jgi:hypothetical protein
MGSGKAQGHECRHRASSERHSYLARQLSQRKIEFRILDNAFGWIADLERAPKLADDS